MMSISPPQKAQDAKQYFSKDDYYMKNGKEEKAEWFGMGALALGLSGTVKESDFVKVLNGNDPHGIPLIQAGGAHNKRIAGFDLTFSAPKSYTILSLKDERLLEMHKLAVTRTLEFIEKNYAQAQQTVDGERVEVHTRNLVAALFPHMTSRELDPQLHTHAFIVNMTQRPDSEWRALYRGKQVTNPDGTTSVEASPYYEHQHLFGQIYRNYLALFAKDLGYSVRITDPKNGFWEIQGVPEELLKAFSKRREQIVDKVKELQEAGKYPNADISKLFEYANKASREWKSDTFDGDFLVNLWNETAKHTGTGLESVLKKARQAGMTVEPSGPQRATLSPDQIVRTAALIHTREETVFTREDILLVSQRLSIGAFNLDDLEHSFSKLCSLGDIVDLRDSRYFTTREMKEIESGILELVKSAHGKCAGVMPEAEIQNVIDQTYPFLNKGQNASLRHILSSNDSVIGVQGDAGTGKTTMLRAAKDLLEKEGFSVKGLSYTGKAAQELEKKGRIPSRTLHAFFHRGLARIRDNFAGGSPTEDPKHIGKGEFWFVDEASMIGSRQMLELLKKAQEHNAKVVLIGDRRQFPAIHAGRPFLFLQDSGVMATSVMTDPLRQKTLRYREIVKDIAEKKIDAAFKKITKYGFSEEISLDLMRERLVNDYKNAREVNDILALTSYNKTRLGLNEAVRSGLKEQKRLHRKDHTFRIKEPKALRGVEKHFATRFDGDEFVSVVKPGTGIKKSAEGYVTSVDRANHTITFETQIGEQRVFDLAEHGDKLAVWKEREVALSKGEKIVFLRNNPDLNVQNGLTGIVKSTKRNGDISAVSERGETVSFNIHEYNYIDYAYVITDYKSQGQDAKVAIVYAPTHQETRTYNAFNVEVTRGQEAFAIYTDDLEELKKQVGKERIKTSLFDYLDPGQIHPVSQYGSLDLHETDNMGLSIHEKAGNVREAVNTKPHRNFQTKDTMHASSESDLEFKSLHDGPDRRDNNPENKEATTDVLSVQAQREQHEMEL